jgi:hypothetical protein
MGLNGGKIKIGQIAGAISFERDLFVTNEGFFPRDC